MSGRYPGHTPNPFSGRELGGLDLPADDVAAEARAARELEAAADRGTARPSADFADRVMAAVAVEPTPAPAVAAGSALRRLSVVGLLASIRDALRVTVSRGFPAAVRVQAAAVVLLAAVIAGTAGVATAGAVGLFNGNRDNGRPAPSVLAPTLSPEPTQSPEPSPSPTPSTSEPTESPTESGATATPEVSETAEPNDTAEPSENESGGSGSGSSGSGGSMGGSASGSGSDSGSGGDSSPTRTTRPTATPASNEDSGDGGGSSTPKPTETATPTSTTDH
jgi:uncharacterized membrane protein YgcG